MPYRRQDLGILMRLDRAEARRLVLAAHAKTGGNTQAAAPLLDVSRRSLVRYVGSLRIRREISAMRKGEAARIVRTYFVVYVQGSGNVLRVGRTSNVGETVKAIAKASPVPVSLLGSVPGDVSGDFCRDFAPSRIEKGHGMWFSPSPIVLRRVEALTGPENRN